jgi:hypothetical protein
VAVNCCVVPALIEGFAGVTAIETRVAAVTVNVVEAVTLPTVALMLELPTPVVVARPVALMVATPGTDELHIAVLVRSRGFPSL